MSRLLTDDEITRQLADLPDWSRDGDTLRASYDAPDFLAGIRLVQEVALLAEAMDHHPDIDIRWRTVSFALSTHSEGGLTQLDVELAHEIAAGGHPGPGDADRVSEPCVDHLRLPACDRTHASTRAPSPGRAIVPSRTAPRLPGSPSPTRSRGW